MLDRDQLEEMELRRQHNERMRKAGEELGKIIDGSEERRQETAALIFGAMRQKYGLETEEEG